VISIAHSECGGGSSTSYPSVPGEPAVDADESEVLGPGLGDEQPVEESRVMRGSARQRGRTPR